MEVMPTPQASVISRRHCHVYYYHDYCHCYYINLIFIVILIILIIILAKASSRRSFTRYWRNPSQVDHPSFVCPPWRCYSAVCTIQSSPFGPWSYGPYKYLCITPHLHKCYTKHYVNEESSLPSAPITLFPTTQPLHPISPPIMKIHKHRP